MSSSEVTEVFKQLSFSINGKKYSVGSNVPPSTSLLRYIREFANLSGSKALCYEGGCGVCTVVATTHDSETGTQKTFSLRSCQTLVYCCAGWAIETIEHLGNKYKGYHSLQKAITGFYGTQCGYCSPGFVMTMYGELKSGNGELTQSQVEKALDGNICRCTGYRPILDAFKSLAVDAPQELKNKMIDIEDSYKAVCPNSGKPCKGQCSGDKDENNSSDCHHKENEDPILPDVPQTEVDVTVDEVRWFRPVSVNGVYKILQKTEPEKSVRFVVGNTGVGVYKNDGPFNVYLDITGIEELYSLGIGNPLVIGANVSLSRCIRAFEEAAQEYGGFKHLQEIANHWKYVANVGIRNTGSWAGNLMMKHTHHEFPSDIFLTLVVIDAKILIGSAVDSSTNELSVQEFMETDMSKSIILSMTIPEQEDNTIFKTYKITPRSVNAHAYVNAAFKFQVDRNNGYKILSRPKILFGGINHKFVNADKTETFLSNRRLVVGPIIKGVVNKLAEELKPDNQPQDASPACRKSLAQSLFYKAILDILGDKVAPELRSGGPILKRPISSGQQHYDENKEDWPVGKPVPKLESNFQVSGEAEYVDDMEPLKDEVHGAFVQSTIAKGEVVSIDASEALKIPGVVAFIEEKDVPGINSFVQQAGTYRDPIFAIPKVFYFGQSLGLIVAERRDVALKAVKLVKVEYKNIEKPVLNIKEALEKENNKENTFSDENFVDSKHVIEGHMEHGSQFHMTMEPLVARVIPVEDGFDVFCSTQWPDETQWTMAKALDISCNSINMNVRRLGGGYGGKISRANLLSCAAAVASNKLRRPVRIALDLNANMTLVGWREPCLSKYKVGFNDDGLLENVEVEMISDAGFVKNETSSGFGYFYIPSVYKSKKWNLKNRAITSSTAANTYCRAPGTTEAIATMENIMEHVAAYLKKEPLKIRELNFLNKEIDSNPNGYGPKGDNLVRSKIFPLLKEQSMYENRRAEIDQFNKEHRWKKKGLTMLPLFYKFGYPPSFRYNTQVVIYSHDGTIVISHGGIEMGQGINTKAAQVAAKILNAPYELIKVKPTDVVIGANSSVTGGCFGSDLVAHGVKVCCEKLQERMSAVADIYKKRFKNDPTWSELCNFCMRQDVDLSERFWTETKSHPKGYDIFGSVCMEIELDVLTGQFLMQRTDIIEDVGRSMSPFIDVGQVEGGFVMGLGYYTSELVKFDPKTGERLSNGTWEYKVPMALDIPTDLRITFLPHGDNEGGVVRSKATGEPSVCMTYCVVTALRDAITSARKDAGIAERWFDMPTPLTVEKIQTLCQVNPATQFVLKNTSSNIHPSSDSNIEDELATEAPPAVGIDFHMVQSNEIPNQEVPDVEACVLN